MEREVPAVEAELAKANIKKAMEQMQYLDLHRDFQNIKAESVNRFVANEQANLKAHINNRAVELLNNAKIMEAKNRQELINGILKKAVSEVEALQRDIPREVVDASFDAALDGIASGTMDYKKDIVLPLILERIRGEVSKLQNLSEEEQQRLLMLTQSQIDQLRSADQHAKEEFLNKAPMGIDGNVRSLDNVKKMYAEW